MGACGSANRVETGAYKEDTISRAQLIRQNSGKIQQNYAAEAKLGEGAFGTVCRATHKATGATRAVKKVFKDDGDAIRMEQTFLRMMDHPNIIRLYETYEDQKHVYLVLELCKGGELFDRIVKSDHKRLKEADTAIVMQDVLRAVAYLHSKDIVHRDLKPENFMLLKKGPISQNVIKLIDYGTAVRCTESQILTDKIGTCFYMSPQVVIGRYGRSCDLWSAGAMMYVMLSGAPAFPGANDKEVLEKVRAGVVSFKSKQWKTISEKARELVRALMRKNPKDRINVEDALESVWVQRAACRDIANLQEEMVEQLRDWQSESRFKKAALQAIAGELCESKLQSIREQFTSLDTSSDGVLSLEEIQKGLQQAGISRSISEVQRIACGLDTDGNGVIEFTEFVAAAMDRGHIDEDIARRAFNVFDLDGDGLISLKEITRVLDGGRARKASEDMVNEVDQNGDGSIDFQEFISMVKTKSNRSGKARSEPNPCNQCKQDLCSLASQSSTLAPGSSTDSTADPRSELLSSSCSEASGSLVVSKSLRAISA